MVSTKAQPVYSEMLGEFFLRQLLLQFIPSKDAAAAAAGWRGDRLTFYVQEEAGQELVLWRLLAGSDGEAIRLFQAISTWLSKRFEIVPPPRQVPFWATNSRGQQVRVEVQETELSILIASRVG
ncbi:MAG: hypothetical protein EBZ48_12585 [Proteobacteria bacterium]|nr:hypothetical protein [Pseudomonadota bacterium]